MAERGHAMQFFQQKNFWAGTARIQICVLQLFNLRKEVDALSAWLATLRAQAGSVALTRRISGAYAAPQDGHHETSPAEERYGSHTTITVASYSVMAFLLVY